MHYPEKKEGLKEIDITPNNETTNPLMNETTNHPIPRPQSTKQPRTPWFPLLRLLLALCLFIGAGCASDNAGKRVPIAADVGKPVEVQKPPFPEKENGETVETAKPEPPAFELIKSYKPKRTSSATSLKGENIKFDRGKMVRLSIENMPVLDFIEFFFGELMGVSYVFEPRLEGVQANKVNINLQEDLPLGKLYPLVLSLLEQNGVGVVFKEGVFRFYPQGALVPGSPNILWGMADGSDAGTSAIVIQIIPLRYLGNRMQELGKLMQAATQKLRVNVTQTSDPDLLMAIGAEKDVRSIVRLVELLDRPLFAEQHIAMVRLRYWSTADFVEKIRDLLRAEGVPVAEQISANGLSFIPVGRLNAVLCFSSEPDWLRRVQYWKELLDVPSRSKGEEGFFVYFPRYARAKELGEVLGEMLSLVGGKTPKKEKAVSGVLDMTAREATPKGGQQMKATQGGPNEEVGAGKGAAISTSPAASFLLEGSGALNAALVVDDVRNALIIYCSPDDYNTIKNLLEQLDSMPKQVLIEVTLAEVTLKDDLQYGVEWYLKNSSANMTGILSTLGGLSLPSGGLSYSMISSSGNFQAMLTMLAKKTNIRILSTPHIMVRDNESASIKIGQDVPVLVSATTSDIQQEGSTQIIQSVEYRATGIMLSVTPTINSRDMVTLEIAQEMSEAQTNPTSKLDSPLILDRSLQTTVVSRHGQSILLGGIISDTKSESINKVPFLGDIPILGYLFKTKTTSRTKIEVLMLVTPRIIYSEEDIDAVRREIIGGMNLLDKRQTGGFEK